MTEQEKGFLVNYLGNRRKEYGIHDAVKERYPMLLQDIQKVIVEGLLIETIDGYILTDAGNKLSGEFRQTEKLRKKECEKRIYALSMERDYLGAYNARAEYERNCIIPHGIHCSFGGDRTERPWPEAKELPFHVKNYIKVSQELDFSDCYNSEMFKSDLRAFYIGVSISGSSRTELPLDFEEIRGEFLKCPILDDQLNKVCLFENPPKLRIYFNTKVSVYNFMSTGLIEEWDGKFRLGVYDCSVVFNFSMAEFAAYLKLGISDFPKTFNTFYKHKTQNSEKYQKWMEQVGYRKLHMPTG